jgi:ABC-2 type transport system permease protein
MRLFVIELRRFWGRRITWVTIAVIAALMLIGVGIGFTQASSEPPDESSVFIDLQCQEAFVGFRDAGDPELQGLSDAELGEQFCASSDGDRRFFATFILDEQTEDWSATRAIEQPVNNFDVDGEEYRDARIGLLGLVPGISTFLLIIAVVLGGSFVGAEYRFGTVENLLLWEPRRLKVYATKCLAGMVSAGAVMAVLTAWLTLLLVGLAQFRGSFAGIDGTFWVDWVATVGRAALMAALFFVLAMAIATLAKNTTAAVVALLGWFVVSNILIELLARWFRHYELFSNASSFIGQGEVSKYVGSGSTETLAYSHGYWVAGAIVAVWAVVPALLAAGVFQRRDIS